MKGQMSCREGVSVLADYLEGTLARSRRAAVDVHVRGCARCRLFLESYLATPRIFRAATEEKMPARLRQRLRRRVRGA